MESKITVLITGCSRHSSEVIKCLKENEDGTLFRIVSVNSSEGEILRIGADASYIVPRIDDPEYVSELMTICVKEKVDVILPYITAELPLMAECKEMIEKTIGTHVSISSGDSIEVLNSKIEIYNHFAESMPDQVIIEPGDIGGLIKALASLNYPDNICCKISGKAGGTGFAILNDDKANDVTLFNKRGVARYISLDDLINIVRTQTSEIILQKHIPGIDYSMVILAEKGRIVEAAGYRGYSMEYGATMHGATFWDQDAYEIVETITRETGLDGNACFDFIQAENGGTYLLECNPRINASMGFLKAHGVNMVYHRCLQLMGVPEDKWESKSRKPIEMRKHYESEYRIITEAGAE